MAQVINSSQDCIINFLTNLIWPDSKNLVRVIAANSVIPLLCSSPLKSSEGYYEASLWFSSTGYISFILQFLPCVSRPPIAFIVPSWLLSRWWYLLVFCWRGSRWWSGSASGWGISAFCATFCSPAASSTTTPWHPCPSCGSCCISQDNKIPSSTEKSFWLRSIGL